MAHNAEKVLLPDFGKSNSLAYAHESPGYQENERVHFPLILNTSTMEMVPSVGDLVVDDGETTLWFPNRGSLTWKSYTPVTWKEFEAGKYVPTSKMDPGAQFNADTPEVRCQNTVFGHTELHKSKGPGWVIEFSAHVNATSEAYNGESMEVQFRCEHPVNLQFLLEYDVDRLGLQCGLIFNGTTTQSGYIHHVEGEHGRFLVLTLPRQGCTISFIPALVREIPQHRCKHCNKSFAGSNISRHLRRCGRNPEKKTEPHKHAQRQCQFCKTYSGCNNMSRHLQRCGKNPGKKTEPYKHPRRQCDFCKKYFGANYIRTHQLACQTKTKVEGIPKLE